MISAITFPEDNGSQCPAFPHVSLSTNEMEPFLPSPGESPFLVPFAAVNSKRKDTNQLCEHRLRFIGFCLLNNADELLSDDIATHRIE